MKKTKILAILVAATMLASCAKAPEETEKTRKERDLMPICASAWTRIHI